MATRRAESGWLFLHDGMPDHPKIEELSDRAFRALVILWCYCSRHLTDGYVSETAWLKRTTVKIRRELIESGLVDTDGEGSNAFPSDFHQKSFEKGVVMHDYLDWQRSAAEATEFSSKKADAGSLGNHQRWHVTAGRRSADCKFCADEGPPEGSQPGSQMRSQVGSHPGSHPDRGSDRKTVAEKIREDKNKTTARQQPRSLASLAEVDNAQDNDPDPHVRGGEQLPLNGEEPPTGTPSRTPSETPSPKAASGIDDGFDEFWAAYPRRVQKRDALKAWRQMRREKTPAERIIAGACGYAAYVHAQGKDPEFVKHPGPWLRAAAYDDHQPATSAGPDLRDPPDVLRAHWQAADAAAVARILGLFYVDPAQPPSDTTTFDRWTTKARRDWISHHHADAITTLTDARQESA